MVQRLAPFSTIYLLPNIAQTRDKLVAHVANDSTTYNSKGQPALSLLSDSSSGFLESPLDAQLSFSKIICT